MYVFTADAKMFDGKDSILKAPTEKGSDAYTQWISRLRRETAQIKEEARRYITTWRSYLNVCAFLYLISNMLDNNRLHEYCLIIFTYQKANWCCCCHPHVQHSMQMKLKRRKISKGGF